MSYRAAVLYDHPVAYYPLDDFTSIDAISDFTDLLAEYSSYQDLLDNVASYSNLYGDTAFDHSGCENDGTYIGDPETGIITILVGNSRSTKITNLNSITYSLVNDYTGGA